MTSEYLKTIGFVLSLATAACGGAPGDPADHEEAAPSGQTEDIVGEHDFEVAAGAELALEATGSWITGEEGLQQVRVPLQGGLVTVAVQPDGTMALETLILSLEDIEVGASLVTPEGGTLTDLRVFLERRAVAEDGLAHVDLELEWSLALPDGRLLELGSPELPELPCELTVSERPDGSLHLDLALTGDGPLLDLAEAVEVTGLSLQLEGIEIGAPIAE